MGVKIARSTRLVGAPRSFGLGASIGARRASRPINWALIMTSLERLRRNFIWAAIAAVVAVAVLAQQIRGGAEGEGTATEPAPASIAPVSIQSELTVKVTFAMHRLAPTVPSAQLLEQASPLKEGGFADRLSYSVLVGAVDGWQSGIEDARTVALPEAAVEPARALRDEVIGVMQRNADRGEDEMSAQERAAVDALRGRLGEVASILTPEGPSAAATTVVAIIAAVSWYGLAFLGGLVVLGIVLVLLATGKMRPLFAPVSSPHLAIVLGEAFLLWIGLFLGLQIAAGIAAASLGDALGESLSLVLSLACFFGSLAAALVYPTMRGMGWGELRQAVGLHSGRGAVSELVAGVLCYLGAVPLLAAGLVVFAILSAIARMIEGPTPPPSHPAVEMLGGAGAGQVVLLYILASVAAPIVEEIMFRGFLYGHLRGACAPRIRVASVAISALASSVVFAIIHPQGVLFVPALGGLAVAFCIAREVRGSLIAPMVAHSINNAVTLTLALTLLS